MDATKLKLPVIIVASLLGVTVTITAAWASASKDLQSHETRLQRIESAVMEMHDAVLELRDDMKSRRGR